LLLWKSAGEEESAASLAKSLATRRGLVDFAGL